MRTLLSDPDNFIELRLVQHLDEVYVISDKIYYLENGELADISGQFKGFNWESSAVFMEDGGALIVKILDDNGKNVYLRLDNGTIFSFEAIRNQEDMWISHADGDKTLFQENTATGQNYIIYSSLSNKSHLLDLDGLALLDIVFTNWGGYILALVPKELNLVKVMQFDRNFDIHNISESYYALQFYNDRFFKDSQTQSVIFSINEEYKTFDVNNNVIDINLKGVPGNRSVSFHNGYAYMIGETNIKGRQVYKLRLNDNHKLVLPGDKKIVVFPNPAESSIKIDHGGDSDQFFQLTIYSRDGSLIKEGEFSRLDAIDVSGFIPGMYFIKLNQDDYEAHGTFYKI